MTNRKTLPYLAAACLILTLAACNTARPSASGVGQTEPPPAPVADAQAQPASPTVPTQAPTPAAPQGWIAYSGDSPGLSLYHPADWTPTPLDDHHIELRPAAGFAWAEISLIDPASPDLAGTPFIPGLAPDALMASLIKSLREDGVFDDASQLPTRSGQAAWVTQGHNDRFGDNVVVGLLVFPDRALMLVGHRGGDTQDWESLKSIYHAIIQSIGL